MKHRIFKLAPRITVFLLLGAIINVAVAWGTFSAARARLPQLRWVIRPTAPNAEDVALWSRHVSKGWRTFPPASAVDQTRLFVDTKCLGDVAFGDVSYSAETIETDLAGLGEFYVEQICSGFPMRCCSWEQWNGAPQYAGFKPTFGDDGVHYLGFVIPRTLFWPFAINTILYAAILWLLLVKPAIPKDVLRRRRIRRGLCPACAYPVGDSAVCTECGRPTPSKK